MVRTKMVFLSLLLLLPIIPLSSYANSLTTGRDFMNYCLEENIKKENNKALCISVLINCFEAANLLARTKIDHEYGKGAWNCTLRNITSGGFGLDAFVSLTKRQIVKDKSLLDRIISIAFTEGFIKKVPDKCKKHSYTH